MRFILAAVLTAALASIAAAYGEGDEDTAAPGMIPSGGLMLYYDSTGPMSFPSMTPKDVPATARALGKVTGRSCQRGLSIPLTLDPRGTSISGAKGDGGYRKALEQIKKEHPDAAGLYDLISDYEVFSVLGIYRSMCTVVTARAFALGPATPAPSK